MFSSTPSTDSISEIVTVDGLGVIMSVVVPDPGYVCALAVSPYVENEYGLVADPSFLSLVRVFGYIHTGTAPGEIIRFVVCFDLVCGIPGEWGLSVGVQFGVTLGVRDRVGDWFKLVLVEGPEDSFADKGLVEGEWDPNRYFDKKWDVGDGIRDIAGDEDGRLNRDDDFPAVNENFGVCEGLVENPLPTWAVPPIVEDAGSDNDLDGMG